LENYYYVGNYGETRRNPSRIKLVHHGTEQNRKKERKKKKRVRKTHSTNCPSPFSSLRGCGAHLIEKSILGKKITDLFRYVERDRNDVCSGGVPERRKGFIILSLEL
jgi:hypothetical protein